MPRAHVSFLSSHPTLSTPLIPLPAMPTSEPRLPLPQVRQFLKDDNCRHILILRGASDAISVWLKVTQTTPQTPLSTTPAQSPEP